MAPVQQNFDQIRPMLSNKADLQQLDALEAWARSSYERLRRCLSERKNNGSIRECHGDIHLGNATLIDGEVVLFDCIEFNEPFRFTDVYADIGFLAMDLEDRGLKSLSRRLISRYLEETGDYKGLEVLNFYKAYRALVRAKIALFSLAHQSDAVQQAATLRQYRNYANLAESYSAIPSRFLAITHGVSAVGKSHVALRLVEALGAIRLRSDVERKRLFGQQQGEQNDPSGIYSAEATARTYQHLHQLAETVLHAGFPVVIDAAYLKQAQRQAAQDVAEQVGTPVVILDCQAPMPSSPAGWSSANCKGRSLRRHAGGGACPAGEPRSPDRRGTDPQQAHRHPRCQQPRQPGRAHSPAPARPLIGRVSQRGGQCSPRLLYSR